MKSLNIVVGLVLFTGLAVGSNRLIGAQGAQPKLRKREQRPRDSTLWFVTTRNE